MAVSRRYETNWPPGEVAKIGIDFTNVMPPGVVIATATLAIYLNQSPAIPSTDFTIGPTEPAGQQVWAELAGGQAGSDYQLRWTVTDNLANTWQRTALLLCAETS